MSTEIAENVDVSRLSHDLRSLGAKPIAASMLEAALQRGQITTREIASFISGETKCNRERLSSTVSWLGQFLKSNQIRIVPDGEKFAHEEKFPFVKAHIKSIPKMSQRRKAPGQKEMDWDEKAKYESTLLGASPDEIGRLALLSPEEELELGRRVFELGDIDARNKLVEHNLRLVAWVAKKFLWSGLEFSDLEQEGCIGLLMAAEKFDYHLGFRFSSYAVHWIRQAIQRSVQDKKDTIRLPVHLQEILGKISKAKEKLSVRLNRVPTLEEISIETEISADKIQRLLLRTNISVCSLDKPIGKNGSELDIKSVIPDIEAIDSETFVEARQLLEAAQNRVNGLLDNLTEKLQIPERDLAIFKMRYGFDNSRGRCTLQDVGDKFSLTRERVRQIINDIWRVIHEEGSAIDHNELTDELARIDELEKIIAAVM